MIQFVCVASEVKEMKRQVDPSSPSAPPFSSGKVSNRFKTDMWDLILLFFLCSVFWHKKCSIIFLYIFYFNTITWGNPVLSKKDLFLCLFVLFALLSLEMRTRPNPKFMGFFHQWTSIISRLSFILVRNKCFQWVVIGILK